MRPLTDVTHKTLLKVGGRTVIQWIVDACLANGIDDLVVVTGYRADEVRAHLAAAYPSLAVTYVHNERYDRTNNICSMALALDSVAIDDDVLLIECDLVFEPSVLRRALGSRHANVALVDRYRRGMDGTVVRVSDDVITEVVTPDRQGAGFTFDDTYKTLNIYRFSKGFCAGTFRKLVSYYAAAVSDRVYYELVLGIVIYLQHETIHAEVLDGERWAELDDPNDLDVARFEFEPASRAATLASAHGGFWNYDVLDFGFLRNQHFPTGAVLSELRGALPALVQNYGSAQDILDRKLSCFLLCRAERLVALNGASQAFPWWRRAFAGARALVPTPTFGEYDRAFPGAARYPDQVGLDPAAIEAAARGHDVLVLVNPNNPTGSTVPSDWIHELAGARPDLTIVVDESFIDFSSQPSLVPRLEAEPRPNVLVLKSLGKSLGVPGLRLGYLYATDPRHTAALRAELPVWNLNAVAEHFLEIVLKHRPALLASFERTVADRESFAAGLREVPLVERVHPSGGSFLLLSLRCCRERFAGLTSELAARHRMYVKDVSSRFPGEGAWARLAVRLPAENARLASVLRQLEAVVAPEEAPRGA